MTGRVEGKCGFREPVTWCETGATHLAKITPEFPSELSLHGARNGRAHLTLAEVVEMDAVVAFNEGGTASVKPRPFFGAGLLFWVFRRASHE